MNYENMTLEAMAHEMKEVRERLDNTKAESSELQKQWDDLRKVHIPNKLEELGIESARITGVGTVSERTDAYCSVPAANRQALYEWLEAHDHGDLITDTVNSSTLKAFMKEQIMLGHEVPDDIVNFNPYTYVAITK